MEFLIILALISHIFISVVIIVVGVFLVATLFEMKKTMQKVNEVVEAAHDGIQRTTEFVTSFQTYAFTIQTGFKVLEGFIEKWRQKRELPE